MSDANGADPALDPRTPPSMAMVEHEQSAAPFSAESPNVMVIVLDDLGFAHLGSYGSNLDTPNLDRLAERGLRLTNFHTTAICSPTRACLLTGRNHHRVGMGMLPDLPTNFSAYTGEFPDNAATMAHILRGEGYGTYCVGKWHLVPRDQRDAGPFHMWPLGQGFDRYYGFLNGETNQWTPNLVRDNTHIEPPADPEDGYHLDVDLADEAIDFHRRHRLANPERPFFMWYATAAPHAPHQAPPEWIERYRGRFDDGWDAWRSDTLARQKEMGIVDPRVELSESPHWVPDWDTLEPDRQRLYARMMEVFAAFTSHADHQIGRVLDHLEAEGELDNTIVVLVSDNGTSGEGGPHGTYNQLGHYISDEEDDLDEELSRIDDLGGWRSSGHYPWGWALAGNTPFRRWKRYTFEGGVRDPLLISGPGIDAAGELRGQYAHVVDVLPTVLDLCGIELPTEVGGIEQMSFDGRSLRKMLDSPDAPGRNLQYFECWGSRAIYRDGFKAVTDHVNQLTANERNLMDGSHDFATDRWALFDTANDPSETTDLAEERPDLLAELVQEWFAQAEANDVFPLDDGAAHRIAHMRVPWTAWRSDFFFAPGDKVHEVNGPNIAGGFQMAATFTEPLAPGATGVLAEQGDWNAGWAMYLADGELRWVMGGFGGPVEVGAAVPDGASVLGAEGITLEGDLEVVLSADGNEIGRGRLGRAVPLAWAPDGAFLTIGYGRPFPVTESYDPADRAPGSLAGFSVRCGTPPPLDVEAEFARVMRHQ
ncbi:MAG: arylsulfatase [Actinomycetia bacterium]|nr:arylsulfatase [Actinomycetes bacterium]